VKHLHGVAEDHRVSIRNLRRDAKRGSRSSSRTSSSARGPTNGRALDEVQKLTDAHMLKVDQAAKAKEKEVSS